MGETGFMNNYCQTPDFLPKPGVDRGQLRSGSVPDDADHVFRRKGHNDIVEHAIRRFSIDALHETPDDEYHACAASTR